MQGTNQNTMTTTIKITCDSVLELHLHVIRIGSKIQDEMRYRDISANDAFETKVEIAEMNDYGQHEVIIIP